jgi:hypothetical protein
MGGMVQRSGPLGLRPGDESGLLSYIRIEGDSMKEVFATMFQDEALVVKSLLESAGIEAQVAGEHFIDVYPIFFPQEGGIKILAADEDEEDAMAVVEQYAASKTGGAGSSEGAGD